MKQILMLLLCAATAAAQFPIDWSPPVVGGGSVTTCSQAEAEAGTSSSCYNTAERVAQAIAALSVFRSTAYGMTCTAGACGPNQAVWLQFAEAAGAPGGTPTGSGQVQFDTTNGDVYFPLLGAWVPLARKVHTHAAADINSGDKAGTDSKLVTAAAKGTTGNCAQWTANGLGDAGAACGSGSGSSPLLIVNLNDNSRTSNGDFTSSGTVASAALNGVGKIIRFRVSGYYNLGAAGQPNLTLKLGSTTIVSAQNTWNSTLSVNHHFVFEGAVTVRSTGASGTTWNYVTLLSANNSAAQGTDTVVNGSAASTVTLDTTASHNFVINVASLPATSTIVIKAVEVYGY